MKRILVVDDLYALRRLFKRFLTRDDEERKERCRVELAADALEAAGIFQKNNFDVAFIDVELHRGPDGFQLAESLRRLQPAVKIIMMSARSQYGSKAVSDFDGFMLKPFTLDEISFHVFH